MESPVLEVKNLTKNFAGFTAVHNVSFSIKKGEVVGLLGPNGAGKTTTIHMLLDLVLPTSGSISYFGKDFLRHRQYCLSRINFISAFNTLQGRISVYENLLVFSMLYGIKDAKQKIEDLLTYFEISDLAQQKYFTLSAGQRTRVGIVKSLLNDPQLILMDEPTAALDPDIADKTLSLIEELRKSRKLSILYTSHNMDEVTRICDKVIFLDHGKIVAQDTPLALTKMITTAELQLTFDSLKKDVEKYGKENKLHLSFPREHVVTIRTEEKSIPHIIFSMSKAGIWITDIEVNKPTLEDVFLQFARKE